MKLWKLSSFTNARLAGEFKLSATGLGLGRVYVLSASEVARACSDSAPLDCRPLRLNLKGMRRIQYQWLRVADVFYLYYDMAIGGNQSRRGGATISKAVHLAAKNTKSLGTSEPTFWSAWKAYKDVPPGDRSNPDLG